MKLRKNFFNQNKFLTTIFIVGLFGMLFTLIIFSKNYFAELDVAEISILEISLAVNIATILFFVLMVRSNIRNSTENAAKDQALKVVNQIIRLKTSALNIDDLVSLICKKLEEYLGGEFWIFLIKHQDNLNSDLPYAKQAMEALQQPLPTVIQEKKNNIYFQPITSGKKKLGILVAKVSPDNGFFYLRKALPVQIFDIINTFENSQKLNESRVNEERESLRSMILSSISHDLKTPLSSIIGSLSIFNDLTAKNKLDEESSQTLIATALEEAERLKSFISDVLEMTRIESGTLKLQRQLLKPSLVVERILKRFEDKLKDYQVEVALKQNIKINFDQLSCEQVIQNLIENAIKYSSRFTKITIWDNIDNGVYYISIKDEGGGINPAKLGQIFNKFERFTMEDKIVGSGLGLSIVKALMEANNAGISAANSRDGTGAVFTMEFRDFKDENEEDPEMNLVKVLAFNWQAPLVN